LALIRASGLRIVEVAKISTTAAPEGRVLSQDPPGGFRALPGDEARLTASRDTSAGGAPRYATITYTVPAGPARRVRVVIVDENGSREIANE
ncbi:MAG: PASTA domain-containing protein, partial [bacterium]